MTPDTIEASLRGIRCVGRSRVSTQGPLLSEYTKTSRPLQGRLAFSNRPQNLLQRQKMLAAIEPCAEPKRVLGLEWVNHSRRMGTRTNRPCRWYSVIGSPSDHSRRLGNERSLLRARISWCCVADLISRPTAIAKAWCRDYWGTRHSKSPSLGD